MHSDIYQQKFKKLGVEGIQSESGNQKLKEGSEVEFLACKMKDIYLFRDRRGKCREHGLARTKCGELSKPSI